MVNVGATAGVVLHIIRVTVTTEIFVKGFTGNVVQISKESDSLIRDLRKHSLGDCLLCKALFKLIKSLRHPFFAPVI